MEIKLTGSSFYLPFSSLYFSEFFDKQQGRDSPARSGEDRTEGRADRLFTRFQRSMQYPFLRLKEYSRLLQKLAESFEVVSNP